MSYTALYRKFRPQEFEDVKGQDHIVTTLKNQDKSGPGTDMPTCSAVQGEPVDDNRKDFCQSGEL